MKRTHMCVNVEGAMRRIRAQRSNETEFTSNDGRPMSKQEVLIELFSAQNKGWRVIPAGACDNFDYQRGCLGHEQDAPGE
jgi:hypothetical protein